jgi:adenylate cyclase, class 2
LLEIEVKIPNADHKELERRLKLLGTEFLGEEKQEDLYLNHPCRDFGDTDEALRLRSANGEDILTYKGPKIDAGSKTREELEVVVEDPESLLSLLERLGFRKAARVGKRRISFHHAGVKICLDKVEGLGDFVELEYMGQELEKGRKAISDLMTKLRLKGNERRSYLELLLEKGGVIGRSH